MNNTLFKMLTAQNQATTNLDARLLDILNKIDQNLSSGRKAMVEISELTSRQLSTFGNQTSESLKNFQASLETNIKSLNDLQREKFAAMDIKQSELIKGTEQKLEIIRNTVEEKLEKTLNERLGQSFETVGKQLIEVQKGLGEMQTIAQDVGGLKKVLSNVKLRGGIGEVQLAMLLEQILAPNQYKANVKISPSRNEIVEFAILLPGRAEDENTIVHLPVDAKFPKDVYENMLNAYETAIVEDIETASKVLESTIRKMAK
ncbi:MAG: DNA recombination protein RmuC, partial [Bacteroidetes bacterium]|nr:DNA recombination protein RmuC [Bacteroidota bacterium]